MDKLLVIGALALFLCSCKDGEPKTAVAETPVVEISTQKWPKKLALNAQATEVVKDWAEFKAMDASFDALYTVKNPEDLILVIEDLIEKQKLLEGSIYPELFNKAQVKGRQKVFKTFFLKVKGNLEYRLDTEEPVLETINAYNAFRNQFNVIVNGTLDTDLILGQK